MKDTTLFSLLLGFKKDWEVTEVVPNFGKNTINVKFEWLKHSDFFCPLCGKKSEMKKFHYEEMPWHQSILELRTQLTFQVPEIWCDDHGLLCIENPAVDALSLHGV